MGDGLKRACSTTTVPGGSTDLVARVREAAHVDRSTVCRSMCATTAVQTKIRARRLRACSDEQQER